eukprot:567812-Rhodomonas_salina.1
MQYKLYGARARMSIDLAAPFQAEAAAARDKKGLHGDATPPTRCLRPPNQLLRPLDPVKSRAHSSPRIV